MTKSANWLPRVFHGIAPAEPNAHHGETIIEGEAVRIEDTLDGMAADIERTRIEEQHAEELLKFRREARENAERRWRDATSARRLP